MSHRWILSLCIAAAAAQTPARRPAPQHLAVCSRCPSPTVTSLTGAGTANAVAEAHMTRGEVAEWCKSEQGGGNLAACIKEQLGDGKPYRATANCLAGRITPIDGQSYTFAGVWDNTDIGGGRTRWRNSAGEIVGRDNASGGLGISQQWEVLCPGPLRISRAPAAASPAARAAAPVAPAEPQYPSVCGGQPGCTEVNAFAASMVDFRSTALGRDRMLTATVRFRNKTPRPLILGFVADAGVALDDQGNRYLVAGEAAVRGIGLIARNTVDPKFVLQPGESSDGRFELLWRPATGREIFGTAYTLDLTVREIVPLPANQFRLGREHAIRFTGLGGTPPQSAPPPSPTPATVTTNAAPPEPPPPPMPDACAGKPRCYSAGPFVAEVLQVSATQTAPGAHHVVRFNVRFRNLTNQPLTLAYKASSSKAADNHGRPYFFGRPGTHDTSAQGIGIVAGPRVDPSFRLMPGEARNASFGVIRFSPPRNDMLGTAFTYDVVIAQLELMSNGQQVRIGREYSLNFQNLQSGNAQAAAPAQNLNESVRKLGDVFRRRK